MIKGSIKYDLVLVVEYFRSVTAYLSIIQGLSSDFSIGVYQVALSEFDTGKNDQAQAEFLKKCQALGADIITSKSVQTSVLLIPQRPLNKDAVSDIKERFEAETTVLLLGFAFPGIKLQDEIFQYFTFKKAYAIDKNFIKFLADKRGVSKIYDAIDIVEVGLPFKKYPIFYDFNADYILAMPTLFSFTHECDKWAFLETVQKLITHVDITDIIVHKPHNGFERDQFSTPNMRLLLQKLKYFPGIYRIFKFVANYSPIKKIRDLTAKLYTAYLYEKVLARTITMEQAGGYTNFAMEAYLPGVKKGVIGGTSNTMWGTLFFKLKFFNCVDISNQQRDGKNKSYGNKKPDKYLELNLQYFMVPYCGGEYVFDEKLWNIPSAACRDGDLIDELRNEIILCSKQV